ncbi:TRAP transporter small permease subunit [Kiloniella sp.]|uniref:TRAP transporter small permease subunit n=1 Tax=Kiloniella sp. TaxID=1938587 RepID=UPI003B01D7EF
MADPNTPDNALETPDVLNTLENETAPAEAGALGRIINAAGSVFAFCFVVSMAVLIYEIVLRHLFDAPTLWAHETTTFLCASGFIFGGLFSASRNKHIRVVIIYDYVSSKVKRWLDIGIYITCAISTGFFSYAAWLVVKRAIFTPGGELRFETSGSAWNPPTPALLKMFLLAVLVVMTVQFIVFAIAHIRGKASPNGSGSNGSGSNKASPENA